MFRRFFSRRSTLATVVNFKGASLIHVAGDKILSDQTYFDRLALVGAQVIRVHFDVYCDVERNLSAPEMRQRYRSLCS